MGGKAPVGVVERQLNILMLLQFPVLSLLL
jgi:hypothetical protein